MCRMQGAVLVTLKKVSNLPAADGNGKSDPYVRFELDDHKRQSTIQRRTLNASWNEKFEWVNVRPPAHVCKHYTLHRSHAVNKCPRSSPWKCESRPTRFSCDNVPKCMLETLHPCKSREPDRLTGGIGAGAGG